jgi:hypothetical protein
MKQIIPKLGMTACALFLSHHFLLAADLTWDGGGADTNWTTDLNWGGNTLSDGDNITFSGSTATTNINDTTGLSLGSITTEGSSTWNLNSTGTSDANALSLSGGIALTGTGAVNIGSDITLTESQTFSNSSTNYRILTFNNSMTLDIGTYDLTLDVAASGTTSNSIAFGYGDTIKGSGTITKTGAGSVSLMGNGSGSPYAEFTGDIFVNEGSLLAFNSGALGSSLGTTTVADGATLVLQHGSTTVAEYISIEGEGSTLATVYRGALSFGSNINLSRTLTLSGASADIGFRYANSIASVSAGLVETTAGSGVVKVGSNVDPSAGFLQYSSNVSYTGTTTIKGGGVIVDRDHGSDTNRVAGYDVTYETLSEAVSGVTGGVTSQSVLAGAGTVYLAADEQISLSGYDGTLLAMMAPGTITAATDVADFTSEIDTFTVDAGNAAAGVTFGDYSAYLAQIGTDGTSDLIAILNGTLTISGSATLILDGKLEDGQVYTLATYSAVSGTFATITGLDSGWTATYGANALTISQIPESSTLGALMGFAVLGVVCTRRRLRRF